MPRTSVSVALALLLASPQALAGVFETLNARHESGAIDDESLHFYRLAAMRAPEELSADLRGLALATPNRNDLTRYAIEAFQWASRNPTRAGRVRRLLIPGPDLDYFVDSATLPIRVTYSRSSDAAMADAVLSAAEITWTKQMGWGFLAPPIESGTQRYRIYVDSTGMGGGGYMVPYGSNGATPWSDCYSYVVYDYDNDIWAADLVTAHEMNHAAQAAMDCEEVTTFWENTATYVSSVVFPEAFPNTVYAMKFFQQAPWRALDYMDGEDGYEYGGALLAFYLGETFNRRGSGPTFLADVWRRAMQNDVSNSKDYYRAIAEATAAASGPTTMEGVLVDFSEARYFVGRNSDGAHIPDAQRLNGAEVTTSAFHLLSEVPVVTASPRDDRRPAPYGVNHVVLSVSEARVPIRVRFDAKDKTDKTRWAVKVLLVGGGPTWKQDIELVAPAWAGTAVVDPSGRQKLVLVVANLGTGTYSPNQYHWPVSSYTYGFELVVPPHAIAGAAPATLTRGAGRTSVQILGSGFVPGREFAVAFDDPLVQIVSEPEVTDTAASLVLSVPGGVSLGPKSVSVTNAGGLTVVAKDLFAVVDPVADAGVDVPDSGEIVSPAEDSPGCGCKTSGSRAAWLTALAAAIPWGAATRRRRGA